MRRILVPMLICLACEDIQYRIDPFPVGVDMDAGVPLVMVSTKDAGPLLPAVIDTASPVTVFDPGSTEATTRRRVTMTIASAAGDGTFVPRARFLSVSALETPVAQVGIDDGTSSARDISAVVGGDVLAQLAVRFDLSRSTVHLFPNIAGDDAAHAEACEAVFPTPPSGGGSFQLKAEEVTFRPSRMVVGTCLEQRELALDARPLGDALLVFATGIAPTVLSQSAFARATGRVIAETEMTASLHLPGSLSPVPVFLASLGRIAFAAQEPSADTRGPCDEVWASRQMASRGCPPNPSAANCACTGAVQQCTAGASVELGGDGGGELPVAVISDTSSILQGLRDELRPAVADVDGFLGASAVSRFRVDVDYPNGRLIVSCAIPAGCLVRPRVIFLNGQLERPICLTQ